ncbi:hypothetical protein J5X84_04235 [Streptosporangiaceae bacterium NEAU-GS5]|nr:hypothetical protein [Streptosporangiaceae bacterium NEAU-GS5]
METRLILIEGMIGAGKSTTSERLAGWLAARGEDVRAFHEFAPDHPIRTKAVDLLRAVHPEPVRSPGDIGPDGLARDPGVYAPGQWERLAGRCRQGPPTFILESTYLQNSVLPAFVNGAPVTKVLEIADRIARRFALAEPLLVYLRPTDIAAAIKHTHEVRGEPWSSFNLTSVSGYPWARQRGLSGYEAVVALYEAWEEVVTLLYDRHPHPKLMIHDPGADWDASLRRVTAAARPSP